ncbi:MAG: hypothetical protein MUO21_06425 [Nitrososphaeraceae archaeon]|nr:hypothetical protein [Nitrososphaeraceae archaeon]
MYRKVLSTVIQASETKLEAKKTTIIIWNDDQHLNEWLTGSPTSNDIRILSIESEILPMIKAPEGVNPDEAAFIALGFGVDEDYKDLKVIYYLTVKPN